MTVTIFDAGGGSAGGVSDGDKGDITVSGGGATWTIDDDVVTNAKLDIMDGNSIKVNIGTTPANPTNMTLNTSQMLGRGSSGNLAAITLGSSLKMLVSATALDNIITRNGQTGTTYTVLTSDNGELIQFTGSADTTFSFTAAATLGSGWFCFISNEGTSNATITLDPNGAETIDGLTTFKMYPGELRLVQCNATNFISYVLKPFYVALAYAASPFTFTKPPGYNLFGVRCGGAGGSGGKSRSGQNAGGGGGGACNEALILASSVGTTETVTIGQGGAAQSSADTSGSAGGNTTFGSLLTGYGGGAGGGSATGGNGGSGGGLTGAGVAGSVATATGVVGGTPGGGSAPTATAVGITYGSFGGGYGGGGDGAPALGEGGEAVCGGGGGGGASLITGTGANQFGGKSVTGGGGGGGAGTTTASGAGGTSKFGGNGGAGLFDSGTATSGTAGANGYGGGGGGGLETGTASGAGGDGSFAIWGLV